MPNEIAEFFGDKGVSDATGFANALSGMTNETAPAGVGGGFLKFDDLDNVWKHGVSGSALNVASSRFAFNVMSFRTGYSHWMNGEKIEKMAKIGEAPIRYEDLNHDLGVHPKNAKFNAGQPITWDPQMSIELQGIDGQDEGIKLRLDATGKGLRSALATVIEEVQKRVAIDQEFYFPIVQLGADPYHNKVRNKESFWPTMTVADWGNAKGEIANSAPAAIEKPKDDAPKRRRRKAA